MIRNKKSLLFLLIITIVFFTGINRVEAIKCSYRLPFSAINPSSGKYLKEDTGFKCYDETVDAYAQDCYIEAIASSDTYVGLYESKNRNGIEGFSTGNYLNSFKKEKGYNTDYEAYFLEDNKGYTASYMLVGATSDAIKGVGSTENVGIEDFSGTKNYHDAFTGAIYDNPTSKDGGIWLKSDTKVCPKYLIVKKVKKTSKLGWAYYRKLADIVYDEHWIIGSGYFDDAYPDNYIVYQTSNSNDDYKKFIKNFYNISATSSDSETFSVNTDSFFNYNNIYLPLYDVVDSGDDDTNQKNIESVLNAYKDVVASSWINVVNNKVKDMKGSCGNNWDKYINLNNYKSSFTSTRKSRDFVSYARNSYSESSLKEPDKDIGEKCWNSRKKFMDMYKSFRVFMYSIGVGTGGKSQNNTKYVTIFGADTSTYGKDNMVYDWKTLNFVFEAVRMGSAEGFDKYTSGNETNNKQMEQHRDYSTADFVNTTLYEDRCSYKCFNFSDTKSLNEKSDSWYESQYNYCKSHNSSYKSCISAMTECGGHTYASCKNAKSNALTQCTSTYETTMFGTTFENCMNEKIPGFTSDYESKKNVASEAKEEAKKAIDTTAKEIVTYKFEAADLLRFKYGLKKYTPKCKDVTFLTSIWNVIIVLAPFLLIIYSAFDYFKVVMAGDEEKMKVSKKKIPRRVIALILLLVFPVILKMLVTKFGTHGSQNTKYIRCILSRDYGENEEDAEEDTKDEDKEEKNN